MPLHAGCGGGCLPQPGRANRRYRSALVGTLRKMELVLEEDPIAFAPTTLPGHRMLRVRLRNAGSEPLELKSRDLELLDDDGESLRASSGFGRSIASATVEPDEVVSIDFAWRTRPDSGAPARVRAGGSVIELLPVHALHDVGERDRFA